MDKRIMLWLILAIVLMAVDAMVLGFAESRAEARRMLMAQRLYTNAYIREFVRKNFPREEDDG